MNIYTNLSEKNIYFKILQKKIYILKFQKKITKIINNLYFIKLGELFRIIVYDLDTEAEIEHMHNFNEPSGYHINY